MSEALVEMLREGHLGMSDADIDSAMDAWFDWIEERRATLKTTDPQALVALYNELNC